MQLKFETVRYLAFELNHIYNNSKVCCICCTHSHSQVNKYLDADKAAVILSVYYSILEPKLNNKLIAIISK